MTNALMWILPLGYVFGILINYLTDILPTDGKFSQPVCGNPECVHPTSWLHYFFLQKCTQCQRRPSLRHYFVILISILALYTIFNSPPHSIGIIGGYLVFLYLLLVALIDFEHRLILRPLSIIGLLIAALVGSITRDWLTSLIGGLAGFGIMLFFYYVGVLFTKYRSKKLGITSGSEESLGSGDVTLAAILGLMLGWPLIWFNLFFGIILAGIFSFILVTYLLITKKYRSMTIYFAYGPFLIFSAVLLLYFPDFIRTLVPGN